MSLLEQVKGISTAPENRFDILHGYPGSGKTTFLGTCPKPVLLVEIGADGGSTVLQGNSDDDIKRLVIPSDISIIKNILDLLDEIEANGQSYGTVAFDTYSAIQDICVAELEKEKGKKLNQQEWGQVSGYMDLIRNRVSELSAKEDRNTVFIASMHSKIVKGTDRLDGTEYDISYPKMTRNNADKLAEKARSVVFMTRKNYVDKEDGQIKVGYYTYIGAMPGVLTKFRTINNTIESGFFVKDATYDKLDALRKGTLNRENLEATNIIEQNQKIDENNPFSEGE